MAETAPAISCRTNFVLEMQNLRELGLTYTLSKHTSMQKKKSSDKDITKYCESLFSACHTGPMTAYSRAQFLCGA